MGKFSDYLFMYLFYLILFIYLLRGVSHLNYARGQNPFKISFFPKVFNALSAIYSKKKITPLVQQTLETNQKHSTPLLLPLIIFVLGEYLYKYF